MTLAGGDFVERFQTNLVYENLSATSLEIALGVVAVTSVEVAATTEDLNARKIEDVLNTELPTLREDRSLPFGKEPADARPQIVVPGKSATGPKTVYMPITRQPTMIGPGSHVMRILTYVRTRMMSAEGNPLGGYEWRSVWSAPTRIEIPSKPKLIKCKGVGSG